MLDQLPIQRASLLVTTGAAATTVLAPPFVAACRRCRICNQRCCFREGGQYRCVKLRQQRKVVGVRSLEPGL